MSTSQRWMTKLKFYFLLEISMTKQTQKISDPAFYITTTLPYVNANPHIWHAMEFIQADTIARYFRQKLWENNVFFNVWTDEHWQKILEKSKKEWLNVQDFVDKYANKFKEFCQLFEISYDNFYRTSDPKHTKVAQAMRKACQQDIYKKKYTWLYCVWCESFKTEKDLVDWKCPDHQIEPIKFEEENYFFKLSAQKDKLLKYLEENPDFIKPKKKLQELINFVKNMQDISISRLKKNLPRWIPVPNDDEQVMYVWFDALSNYVWAIWFPENQDKLNRFRPWIQICWPDNLRFQWAIRQWMLASAWLPFSKKILVHWMILWPDWNKMSKTIWNVISPFEQLEKYWAETVRFYMICGLSTYWDSAYKEDDLKNLVNNRIADTRWNLLNRVIHLANKKWINLNNYENINPNIKKGTDEFVQKYHNLMNNFELDEAFLIVHQLWIYANNYIDQTKPRNKELSHDEVQEILQSLGYILNQIQKMYYPVVPNLSQKAKLALENMEKTILFEKIN